MKLRTFIICDDIRNELGGKHSLIGTYRDRIIFSMNKEQVNSWPKSIRLAFFIEVDFDKKICPHSFVFNMIEDGVTQELFRGGFSVNKDSKTIILSLLHPSLKFKQAGTVNFEIVFFDDKHKPLATLRPDVDFSIEERLI
jgi:hypothetical protein